MPLTVAPGELDEQYLLKSGGMTVGYVHLIPKRGLPIDGMWMWATNYAAGGSRNHGNADTREQAEALVRTRFEGWLQWAGLQER